MNPWPIHVILLCDSMPRARGARQILSLIKKWSILISLQKSTYRIIYYVYAWHSFTDVWRAQLACRLAVNLHVQMATSIPLPINSALEDTDVDCLSCDTEQDCNSNHGNQPKPSKITKRKGTVIVSSTKLDQKHGCLFVKSMIMRTFHCIISRWNVRCSHIGKTWHRAIHS